MSKQVQQREAVFLIDDYTLIGAIGNPAKSGWDLDIRERSVNIDAKAYGMNIATDKNSREDVFIKRRIVTQDSGKLGFHHCLTVVRGESFYLSFLNCQEECVFELSSCNGYFYVNGNNTEVPVESKTYYIDGSIDLDEKKADILLDGKSLGEICILENVVDCVKIGAKAHTETYVAPGRFHLWRDYIICDKYTSRIDGLWSLDSDTAAEAFWADTDYNLVCKNGGSATLSRTFDKAYGRTGFEIKYLPFGDTTECTLSLVSGTNIITFNDKECGLYYGDKLLRKHLANVWQTLYVVADTESHKVNVSLNGKDCGSYDFDSKIDFFDGIKIGISGESECKLLFSEILVSLIPDTPSDYVPEPILPTKKDYLVGINTCSLWRNGHHIGWDVITPFEECKPYLGYYDEGIAETSDWEIKWMSEHGIDFQFFCWFNYGSHKQIKRTSHSAALHDGYFKAKYKNYLKFAIIWEALGGSRTNETEFREFIVPYWMDYFFSDPKYLTIDNKVVLAVYSPGSLIRDFGSAENVRSNFAYLNEQVKTLGLDGITLVYCGRPSEQAKECGFEAVYAYNWNEEGSCPEFTENIIKDQRKNPYSIKVIPTASTGFNAIAWHGKRSPQLSLPDMADLLEVFKTDMLSKENSLSSMVMFSTWNEYGEGTYICPSELCGFGYLDVIRKAFTEDDVPHNDARPSENQLSRICNLYPQDRGILRPLRRKERKYPDEFVSKIDILTENYKLLNGVEIHEQNGIIVGKSEFFDPQIELTGLNIDTEKVKSVRITMKGSTFGGRGYNITLYFKTDASPNWSEDKGLKCFVHGNNLCECNFNFSELSTWQGTVTGFRIDPLAAHGTFEIHAIELMTDTKSPVISFNGKEYRPSVSPIITENEIYIPFESFKPMGAIRFYSEWNKSTKTLMLAYGGKKAYFTLSEDYTTVNGKKVSMPEPLFEYDGLPMLGLGFLCEIFGLNLSIDGRYINVNEQQ